MKTPLPTRLVLPLLLLLFLPLLLRPVAAPAAPGDPAAPAPTADWTRRYADLGDWIVTNLATAPFPHPARAAGRQYQKEFFSAAEHYEDNTVAIFIPRGFKPAGRVDYLIHFHGWRNHVEQVFARYHLAEQTAASGRNVVLVVPQGPRDAADSFGGKLEDAGGFTRFMTDVSAALRSRPAFRDLDASPGRIILSGHSGGYQVIGSILDHGGLTDRVAEVWLFDALYARTSQFLAWHDRTHGRLIDLYTDHGGTVVETKALMTRLKERGTPFLAAEEADLKPGELTTNRLLFLHTKLEHDEVLQTHELFRQFLATALRP